MSLTEHCQSPMRVLPLILAGCDPRSALDVGCNCGPWLRVLIDHGVDDVLGIDALPYGADWLMPQACYRQHDLHEPFDLGRRFDLVICLEVAEHVEAEFADGLVASICRHSDVVLWSAAVPGQGGDHHVNEQWTEYWCAKFAAHGYEFLDPIRRLIWADEAVFWWYRQNMVMFATPEAVACSPFLDGGRSSAMFSVIHPRLYGRY